MPGGFPLWLSTDPKSHISWNSLLPYRALTNTGYERNLRHPPSLAFKREKLFPQREALGIGKDGPGKLLFHFQILLALGMAEPTRVKWTLSLTVKC